MFNSIVLPLKSLALSLKFSSPSLIFIYFFEILVLVSLMLTLSIFLFYSDFINGVLLTKHTHPIHPPTHACMRTNREIYHPYP